MTAATPRTTPTALTPRPSRRKATRGQATDSGRQRGQRLKRDTAAANDATPEPGAAGQQVEDNDAEPGHHELCEQDRNYAFSVAMKYVKDEDAAADVAQETLLLAHRHRHSFRGDSRYSTWLYRIAATTALMHLRKAKRRKREVLVAPTADADDQVVFERPSPRSTPEERGAAREAMEIVRQRLEELGEKYQDIFWLRFFEGYTETEIAKRLDLNVATVKTRAYRARLAIRETLQQHLQAPSAAAA